MSSKKSKKKINGGDIIKNMFGGTEIKDLDAKIWIIIILVSIIILTLIIVYITPHIVKFFKKQYILNKFEKHATPDTIVKLFDKFINDISFEGLKEKICKVIKKRNEPSSYELGDGLDDDLEEALIEILNEHLDEHLDFP